jgi:hypothetical protein
MGRRVAQRRRPIRTWMSQNWEAMLILTPIGAVALIAIVLAQH